ncbi:MAG: TerB N-terminal domain-containing protein [Planctomycetaceae bacterium]|nr:TerB N-terminal domain-containing protein [Planctomycetaceae bacterium]
MEDIIRQLIDTIVSSPRIASGSNFASKVYRDEPILFTAPQMARYTPPRIADMRRLAPRNDKYGYGVFYKQARFMEEYEDDFDYRGEYIQYSSTYEHMTDAELRGYFTWRAKVRKGVVEKTSLSFAFVHIYELLHCVGAASPEEGFHALYRFWQRYREHDQRIDPYTVVWLRDMVLYYDLDPALLAALPGKAMDDAMTVALNYREHGAETLFPALLALSSYKLAESKFYLTRPDEVKEAVCRVFADVSAWYDKAKNKSACDHYFGRMRSSPYFEFKTVPFGRGIPRKNCMVTVNPWQRFVCVDGNWTLEQVERYGKKNDRIGALLKMVDYLLRQHHGYKSSLQPAKMSKVLRGKIEKSLAAFLQERAANTPRTIAIDVDKLHGIRTAALATQSRLLVDGAETEAVEATGAGKKNEPEEPQSAPASGASRLSGVEAAFLGRLLTGEVYDDLLRQHRVLLSVLVDAINEKLFDELGDTAIVEGAAGPEVLDDYQDVLKGSIGQ